MRIADKVANHKRPRRRASFLRRPTAISTAVVLLAGTVIVVVQAVGTRPAAAEGVVFAPGDVFLGLPNGTIAHYGSAGTLVDTLHPGPLHGAYPDEGMCFDSSPSLDLYTANFGGGDSRGSISKFQQSGYGQLWVSPLTDPQDCVVDDGGNVWVGLRNYAQDIQGFSPTGQLRASYAPSEHSTAGVWSLDLASDHCTMYSASGGGIQRFNVCTGTQLADLTSSAVDDLRIRANGEIIASYGYSNTVMRLSSSGALQQTYTVGDLSNHLGAVALDADGTSFWVGDSASGSVWKVDIPSGAVLMQLNAGGSGIDSIRVAGGDHVLFGGPLPQSAFGVGNGIVGAHNPWTEWNTPWTHVDPGGS